MYQNQVFCFTPKGELISLPSGSTVVDFAYAVHTKVGDTCVGGTINGKPVQLRTRLRNGDQVEISRSSAQQPSPSWLSFVITGKAKSAIRRFIRQRKKLELFQLGEAILQKSFAREEREFSEKTLEIMAEKLNISNPEDVCIMVAQGELTDQQVLEAIFPGIKLTNTSYVSQFLRSEKPKDKKAGKHAIPIRGLTSGLAVHLGECCHPLPGDRIVGIVEQGKGIMVHTIDCESLDAYADSQETWLDLSWREQDEPGVYSGTLDLLLEHEPGALATVLQVVAQELANVNNIKFNERSPDLFRIELDLEVRDVKHLSNIITALRSSKRVNSVERSNH